DSGNQRGGHRAGAAAVGFEAAATAARRGGVGADHSLLLRRLGDEVVTVVVRTRTWPTAPPLIGDGESGEWSAPRRCPPQNRLIWGCETFMYDTKTISGWRRWRGRPP